MRFATKVRVKTDLSSADSVITLSWDLMLPFQNGNEFMRFGKKTWQTLSRPATIWWKTSSCRIFSVLPWNKENPRLPSFFVTCASKKYFFLIFIARQFFFVVNWRQHYRKAWIVLLVFILLLFWKKTFSNDFNITEHLRSIH